MQEIGEQESPVVSELLSPYDINKSSLLWQAFDICQRLRFGRSSSPVIRQSSAEKVRVYQCCSDTVSDMINAVYHDKPFIFIKAVSDTVLAMINAVYHDKPFIFIKAVSDTVLAMINAVYHDKPFIFIKAVSDTVLAMMNAVYHDKP